MSELERRLRAAVDPVPGADWLDVRRRARRPRRRAALALAAAAAALLLAVPALGVGERLLDLLAIERSEEPIPAPRGPVESLDFVHGRRVHRAGTRAVRLLAAPVRAPLLGENRALAIPAPRGDRIVYHAWEGRVFGETGVPVLRVYSRETGRDRVLARGAQSVAWRRDGALAYTQATRRRYESSAAGTLGGSWGHVVVRGSLGAPAVRWTRASAKYVVFAWARTSLLVEVWPTYTRRAGVARGVYALDGAGRLRPLPLRELIAVSPDGRSAIGSFGRGDGPSVAVRLVDVSTGKVLASLAHGSVSGPGDWTGRTVVAAGATRGRRALLVFAVSHGRLVLRRRLGLGPEPSLRGTYGPFLSRPVFVRGDRHVVVRVAAVDASGERERGTFAGFLTCDRVARRCTRGRNLLPARSWAGLINNPSRPE